MDSEAQVLRNEMNWGELGEGPSPQAAGGGWTMTSSRLNVPLSGQGRSLRSALLHPGTQSAERGPPETPAPRPPPGLPAERPRPHGSRDEEALPEASPYHSSSCEIRACRNLCLGESLLSAALKQPWHFNQGPRRPAPGL
ncbi:protein piccolo-like [Tupaia chinensis]|uniref:protein piccolo-like n=1 Tax=Tupaia chinensis TaxID=246437 RepID=UPI000704698E|nr:protein piccolo-like [Tupaia chinensis]